MTNKTNTNPIDRINRIAITGELAEPQPLSPVDNIMQHYPSVENKQLQTPEEGGFWNGLKKFAGSKGGRMALGGLGTGLAVALTGGNVKDALGYGVIGAGKTAENLYNQEQKEKEWQEKEAERLFRQQESEANRQHDWDIANARIEADRQARKDEMDRVLKTLELKDQYGAFDKKGKTPAEQLKALADAGATPESLNMFAEANGLTGYKFEGTKPKLSGQAQLLDYMINDLGYDSNLAIAYLGKMTPEQKAELYQKKVNADKEKELEVLGSKQAHDVNMAGINYGYDSKLQEQKDIAKMRFEEFKNRLPTEQQRNIEAQAKALNIDPAVIYQTMKDKEDALIEKIIAESGRIGAQTGYTNAQTDFLTGAKTDLTKAQTDNINARTGIVGKTPQMLNAEWLANNPNATMEQKIAMGISGTYGKAYNDAIITGKTTEEANKIAMAKVQQDIITGQIMSDMFGSMPSGQPPIYPQESTEDVEYVTF